MKDPSRNPAFESSFTFTGTITDIKCSAKKMQVMIRQDVAGGRLPTDYNLVIPAASVQTEDFPYAKGDTVMVEDALLYEKDSEFRLRIETMDQIRATTAQPGELNSLSFSGQIVEVKAESGYKLLLMEQNVKDTFLTRLEVILLDSAENEIQPKVGDIGFIKSALFYEKDSSFRARLTRSFTYKVLYTPDVVMNLGTIEAKEKFI